MGNTNVPELSLLVSLSPVIVITGSTNSPDHGDGEGEGDADGEADGLIDGEREGLFDGLSDADSGIYHSAGSVSE